MKNKFKILNFLVIALGLVAGILLFMASSLLLDASNDKRLIPHIENVCLEYNICPELVEAIIERESSWIPEAENVDCIGLMQVSEKWHKDRMERLGAKDLKNPYDNIIVGVDYLAELFEKYEDVGMVLMIYNGDSDAEHYWKTGEGLSRYATWILDRSAELERKNGK